MELPYADSLNYWKTSRSSPDTWIERARRHIEKLGGVILGEAFGRNAEGRSAYMLTFEVDGSRFRVVWPVLPVKKKNDEYAARVQAATMLCHDIKAKCLTAKVLGARSAFFPYMLLPDGRQISSLADPDIEKLFHNVTRPLLPQNDS